MRGQTLFEPVSDNQTKITIQVEFPGMDEMIDKNLLISRMERSGMNIKKLMETEIPG
jgi:hypothetical protein